MREQKKKREAFRDLNNYKSMHTETARKKGVTRELEMCTTLTEARKVLFGTKRGSPPPKALMNRRKGGE